MPRNSATRMNKITEGGRRGNACLVSALRARVEKGRTKKTGGPTKNWGEEIHAMTRKDFGQHVDAANKDVSKFLTCHGFLARRGDGWRNFLSALVETLRTFL